MTEDHAHNADDTTPPAPSFDEWADALATAPEADLSPDPDDDVPPDIWSIATNPITAPNPDPAADPIPDPIPSTPAAEAGPQAEPIPEPEAPAAGPEPVTPVDAPPVTAPDDQGRIDDGEFVVYAPNGVVEEVVDSHDPDAVPVPDAAAAIEAELPEPELPEPELPESDLPEAETPEPPAPAEPEAPAEVEPEAEAAVEPETPAEPETPVEDELPKAAGFSDLGLRRELLDALARLGYEEPTPIQRETIPLLLDGRDLLGQAATGTGKTAAFALPILEHIPTGSGKATTTALILVPTRELAVQVSEAIYRYGRDLGAQVLPIYGGQPIGRQLDALKRGVHVVVATPGRALDHIKRGTLPLSAIEIVVLDEADEMLDMGFAEDIEAILEATPEDRQTVLFSATMPGRINSIARRHQNDPVRIQIGTKATDPGTAPLVRQSAYIVARAHKPAALGRVLDVESPGSAIVFCRTRIEVDSLSETLNGRGYRAEALHGGMSQEQRDRAMGRLKNGTADLLIATDVAARGLDIDQLTHVVNYDVPSAPEAYVHRIGRVGRAGREGVAITLAEPREQRLLGNIERLTKQKIAIEKVPSVADLRARQMELTLNTLREGLLSDDLERFRYVVDTLSDEFEIRQIALAAVKLAHEASGAVVDEQEIPEVAPKKDRKQKGDFKKGEYKKSDFKKGEYKKGEYKGKKSGGSDGDKDGYKGKKSGGKEDDGEVARIWIGVGRDAGVRPKDLVGAIANETSLSGRDIGAISIQAGFSLVEVPESSVDEVTWALKRTHIKGNKAKARRDRDGA